MGFRSSAICRVKQILHRSNANKTGICMPKGYLAVYVGENRKKRYIIPVSYLNQPSFQELLSQAEEEFGYNHPMGGLTIPCREGMFYHVISCLNGSIDS